jgi:alkanesulfonate monooxygenase SsuD/methylene tetrahydromethanopterin reductase-like flavin-dependent oxidoreductase (luciferase family)
MTLGFWIVASPEDLTRVTQRAAEAEQLGFHGIAFGDSQNRSGDTIVALTPAACATERLMLSTGGHQPIHPPSRGAGERVRLSAERHGMPRRGRDPRGDSLWPTLASRLRR